MNFRQDYFLIRIFRRIFLIFGEILKQNRNRQATKVENGNEWTFAETNENIYQMKISINITIQSYLSKYEINWQSMKNENRNKWIFAETNEIIYHVKMWINIGHFIDRNENEIFETEMAINELHNLETRIFKLRNLTRQRKREKYWL